MQRSIASLIVISTMALLSACAPFSTRDQRAGVCNELNSQLIFNGSTSNIRKQSIENAAQPKVQQSYDRNNCSQ